MITGLVGVLLFSSASMAAPATRSQTAADVPATSSARPGSVSAKVNQGDVVLKQLSPEQQAFARSLAADKGLDIHWIVAALQQARRQQSVLDAISRPAERKPWFEYRPIFLTEKRVRAGVAFWNKHRAALQRAEKTYGVPAEIIVSIIGVETFYGRIKGHYRVLDALYTLGFYYPPRAKFFRGELARYFELAQQQGWAPQIPMGSYAGAMGYGQFMPSSQLAYAVDFDGDGKIDLVNSAVDAIGSVGHYFARHGWKTGAGVICRVYLSNWQAIHLAGSSTRTDRSIAELLRQGIRFRRTLPCTLPGNTPAALLKFRERGRNAYWVGLQNFYVISRYNHSPLYSLAAFQLSQAIRKRVQRSSMPPPSTTVGAATEVAADIAPGVTKAPTASSVVSKKNTRRLKNPQQTPQKTHVTTLRHQHNRGTDMPVFKAPLTLISEPSRPQPVQPAIKWRSLEVIR